jgi:hypothetical protein
MTISALFLLSYALCSYHQSFVQLRREAEVGLRLPWFRIGHK